MLLFWSDCAAFYNFGRNHGVLQNLQHSAQISEHCTQPVTQLPLTQSYKGLRSAHQMLQPCCTFKHNMTLYSKGVTLLQLRYSRPNTHFQTSAHDQVAKYQKLMPGGIAVQKYCQRAVLQDV